MDDMFDIQYNGITLLVLVEPDGDYIIGYPDHSDRFLCVFLDEHKNSVWSFRDREPDEEAKAIGTLIEAKIAW